MKQTRRLTLLLMAALTCLAAQAQTGSETWWGYYPPDATQARAIGDNAAQTYHAAIRIAARYVAPDGGQIAGVRFKLSTTRVANLQAWMSTTLPEAGGSNFCQLGRAERRWFLKETDEGFALRNSEGIYAINMFNYLTAGGTDPQPLTVEAVGKDPSAIAAPVAARGHATRHDLLGRRATDAHHSVYIEGHRKYAVGRQNP